MVHVFLEEKVLKEDEAQMAKVLRKLRGSSTKLSCFYWPIIDISSLLHSKC